MKQNGDPVKSQFYVIYILLFAFTNITAGQNVIYGLLNAEITLKPISSGFLEEIIWKHNMDKVAEYDQDQQILYFAEYNGRTTLDIKNGYLTIKDLTKKDSGKYSINVQISGKLQTLQSYNLIILEHVPKPTVTCKADDLNATLRCLAQTSYNTQYRWEGPQNQELSGSELPIKREGSQHSEYTCIVSNPVSESRSEVFHAEHCFPSGTNSVPIIVGIVLLISLLFIVVLAIRKYKKKYKKEGNVQKENEADKLLRNEDNTDPENPATKVEKSGQADTMSSAEIDETSIPYAVARLRFVKGEQRDVQQGKPIESRKQPTGKKTKPETNKMGEGSNSGTQTAGDMDASGKGTLKEPEKSGTDTVGDANASGRDTAEDPDAKGGDTPEDPNAKGGDTPEDPNESPDPKVPVGVPPPMDNV
ncbi:SLAM family member 5 [Amia ocellicauda]|uniref:SLAM family member 5 n=1 Tax=Amia ocellicauda TaxID=2972642 RepID=UPI0034642A31